MPHHGQQGAQTEPPPPSPSGLGKWITSPETVPTEDSGIVWSYIRHISMMSMSYENIILYVCQLNIMQLNKNIMKYLVSYLMLDHF